MKPFVLRTGLAFILLFLFFYISQGLNAQENLLFLKTTDGELSGTLSVPAQKNKMPLVLLIAGSGPTDRNGNQPGMENNSLKFLAAELLKNGIASLRYDKRSVGSSVITEEIDLRFDTYISDAKAWTDLLATDPRFSRIIIAGHSEGSLVGMLAAVNNKKVNAFISIAGAGRPIDEILKEQMSGVQPEARSMIYSMLDTLRAGDTISNVPVIFYSLFRPSVQPYMISWIKYDPKAEIAKLNIPVLILNGTTDIQVKVKDAQLLAAANPLAKLKIIENMNHVLKECKSEDKEIQEKIYEDPNAPLKKELMETILPFIKQL
jgi:pimeloyl-ACP methyl ester carboxylesterase